MEKVDKIKVIHFGLSLNRGGIETYLHKVASNINKKDFSFSFINSTSSKPCFYEELRKMGCAFYNVTPRRKSVWRNKQDLDQLFRENDFDVLHFHVNTLSYIDPVLVALKYGVKVVVHSRNAGAAGSRLTQLLHRINKARINRLKNEITKVAVSELAGEWLFGQNTDFAIYNNGIDLEKFRFLPNERDQIRNELNIGKNTFLLGNVGAFVPAKNQEFAVQVLHKVLESGVDAKLVLIGDGALKKKVIDFAERLNLSDKVLFLGKREDMPSMFSALDVFLFPSHYEGFPNAVLEAQACGLPALISDAITKEVVVDVENCKQLPIASCDYGKWAVNAVDILESRVNDIEVKDQERVKSWEKIEVAGFSIKEEIIKLETLYKKVINS